MPLDKKLIIGAIVITLLCGLTVSMAVHSCKIELNKVTSMPGGLKGQLNKLWNGLPVDAGGQ